MEEGLLTFESGIAGTVLVQAGYLGQKCMAVARVCIYYLVTAADVVLLSRYHAASDR